MGDCLENPLTAKRLLQKPTNSKVLGPTQQLYCEWMAVGGFLEKAFRSWVIGTGTLQLVDTLN